MFSTGRRRIAWLLATTLVVACGGATDKVENPRSSDTESEVDPDDFEITDEDDREVVADDEESEAPREEPEVEEEVAEAEEAAAEPPPKPRRKKKAKKVVEREPEPERVADEEEEEEEEEPVEEDERPARVRVNRQTLARYRRGDVAIGAGRSEREARMARDERLRAKKKGRRGGARERDEEIAEERAERAEEAREAKEARAEEAREKARARKEARAEKAAKAKEARAAKARKAKEAREAKARKAKEARAAKARKAKASEDEDEDTDDFADEEEQDEETPKKGKVDEDLIEMDGEEEDEELDEDDDDSTSIASIEEDDPLAEQEIDKAEPEPVVVMPVAINDRALTIAAKKLAVHGRLGLQTLTLPGAMPGTTVSSTSESLALGFAYGIGKKAEVGADYTLSLNPGAIKGPLAFHVAYSAKHTAKLDFAIAAGLAFDFIETANMATMTTTTTSFASLQLGAWARYRATPKVSLFTGLPALPAGAPSLSKQSLALPPFAYQVAIGLNNAGATAIELPIGLGYQAKPNFYAFASFDLAHIRLANTQTALIFADFIPFTLGGFYTHKKIDIGVQLSDDFKQGSDYLRLDTVLRYYMK